MSIAEMSLIGGIMILAVVILRAFGVNKLPKRAFILLWEIVLLRLLLPVSIPLPILPAVNNSPYMQAIVPQGLPAHNNSQLNAIPGANGRYSSENEADTAPYVPKTNAEAKQPARSSESSGRAMPIKAIYLIGVAAAAGFFALSYAYSMYKFSGSEEIENEYILNWLKSHKSARRISVRYYDKAVSPMTYGVLMPVILLPRDIDFSDRTRLDYILEHEFAHIRHFDSLKKLIAAAALCLHWFNPLVWLMNMLYNRDIELWCDECVIAKFGEESRSTYARVLIAMEELKISALPISGFGRSPIKERITSIMKFKKTTIAAVICAVMLTVTAVVAIAATSLDPVPKKAESPAEPQPVNSENENASITQPPVEPNMNPGSETAAPDEPGGNKQTDDAPNSDAADLAATAAAENTTGKKRIYDSSVGIDYWRRDGETISPGSWNTYRFEKGERAAIVFEFDYEPTEAEKAIDVFVNAWAENDGGHLYYEGLEMILTSKIISGNTVTFLFEASRNAHYSFEYSSYAPKWLYALDYYVELESAVTPGKFGSQVIDDFKCEYTTYSDEEFNDYIESKYLEFGHTQLVTDVTQTGRTYAIEEDIDYIQVGEPIRAWSETKCEDERFAGISGTYGLYYTVDNCTVYDSWRDSGIPEDEIRFIGSVGKDTTLKFIVLDMTATYNKPSADSVDEIQAWFGLHPVTRSEGTDIYENDYATSFYFSAHPTEGDVNIITKEPLRLIGDYAIFGKPIKDGQPVHFQYAIFAKESVIEDKTLYLRDCVFRTFDQDDKIQYVDLFGNK